jgi:hypothetical protein
MTWVGFEPTIAASERAKTVYALERSATVTGERQLCLYENVCRLLTKWHKLFSYEVSVASKMNSYARSDSAHALKYGERIACRILVIIIISLFRQMYVSSGCNNTEPEPIGVV